jgi:hypothetical protein
MKFTKIEEFDEALEYLGFTERKVYQFESDESKTTDEVLSDILKSEIFFETQNYTDFSEVKSRKYEIKTIHAFSDKIEISDFEKLTFDEFETRIEEIKKEPDWGEDLPIFGKLIANSKNWILENNYQNGQLYFIYAESISKQKLIEHNYYSYFMAIVIISNPDSKVIIINHGGD